MLLNRETPPKVFYRPYRSIDRRRPPVHPRNICSCRDRARTFSAVFRAARAADDSLREHEFSDQDMHDIQVWWTLVWLDHHGRPAHPVRKGRRFSDR